MPSFRESRDFLLTHRTDYEAAYAGFRWPDAPAFNWALDWFDADLAARPESRDRPALWIVDAASGAETKLSFAEMSARSNRVANHLRALGLKRGDHLLLLLGNVPALWETMLAAMKLGAVVIPATTLLTGEELADRLERGRARMIVAGPDQVAKCDDQVAKCDELDTTGVIRVVTGTTQAPGWHPYAEADAASERFEPDAGTGAEDPLLLYFTSGTTAKPKLVRHSHRSYPAGALST
ncbi:MAG TPA: AMP-binding protein, partial [Methylobacterium sp.]|nr:AMP-binding protein [Methylobacterium sp.]